MYKHCYKILILCILSFGNGSNLFSQTFQDISVQSGIDFTFLEANHIGGGISFFDYDGDGDEDIYITGGESMDRLYRKNADLTFTDVTIAAGLDITGNFYTTGVITGDVDNDGFREIYVQTWGNDMQQGGFNEVDRTLFFKNNGDGTFTEDANSRGIDVHSFSIGATFLDFNNDGFLDLYVINYIEEVGFIYDEFDDDLIVGFDHICYSNNFYLNDGTGNFIDATATLNLENDGCSLAVIATDYDQDNDIDIYIANDFGEFEVPNTLYRNNYPNNSFTDVSASTGANVGIYGMGIAAGDYDLDGDFDYYITNLGRNVLLNNNASVFTDVATPAGVENTNTPNGLLTTGWGTAFFDYDNDKYPDLFVANGRIPAAGFISTGDEDPNKLYHNNQDNTFLDVSNTAGISDLNKGRGMAYADIDNDGDLDLGVIVQNNSVDAQAKCKIYQNNTSNSNNYLKIKLVGTLCNRDAFGSKISLYCDNGTQLLREIDGGGASHCSQHSSIAHFGLGNNTMVDSIVVNWLGGTPEKFYDISSNQTLTIVQEAVALPINLLSFNARAKLNSIQINWTTDEADGNGFELQRSLTPFNGFEKMGWFESKGDLEQNYYEYEDEAVEAGLDYYYRLKILDVSGEHYYSTIASARLQKEKTWTATIHPNPATDITYLNIDSNFTGADLNVKILSARGQLLKTFNFSDTYPSNIYPIDLNELSSTGIYFIVIENGQHREVRKVTKN